MYYSFVFGRAGSPSLRELYLMAANGSYSLVAVRGLLVGDPSLLGHKLSSCDARAPLFHGMWAPSASEIEPMSLALAGRLFTTQGSTVCITFIVEKNR